MIEPLVERKYGVRLTLAYDGTAFAGFQRQQGQRTVQQTLAEAAARVCQHGVEVFGASRTDSGVHAEGQVVAFGCDRVLTPRRWVYALNRYLPPDISVRSAEPCAPDYQPRFDASFKRYRYLFHLGPARDALLRHRAWHLGRHVRRVYPDRDRLEGGVLQLDLERMQQGAAMLEGRHDFAAFRAAADQRETTVRTMHEVRIERAYAGDPELLALHVQGSAFMKNMVRIMAGTLVDLGSGRLPLERLEALLQPGASRRDAGVTAPPEGLTLVSVTLGREQPI